MVGRKIGGVNVFGGGLALYNSSHVLVGGLGVSGDSSCADHNIAWRTRDNLNLDFVPAGVAAIFAGDPAHKDNIVYDIKSHPFQMNGVSQSGWATRVQRRVRDRASSPTRRGPTVGSWPTPRIRQSDN
jgi:hypothetical protein